MKEAVKDEPRPAGEGGCIDLSDGSVHPGSGLVIAQWHADLWEGAYYSQGVIHTGLYQN